mgnify:CR=1 FL=1
MHGLPSPHRRKACAPVEQACLLAELGEQGKWEKWGQGVEAGLTWTLAALGHS